MSMKQKVGLAAILALSLGGGVALVSAHQVEDDDAKERAAVQAAKVTLGEAIAAAEKEVAGGRAFEAEVDTENGVTSYFVEVDKDGVQRVQVDMQTGQAVKVAEADDDGDDDDDSAAHDDDDDDDDSASRDDDDDDEDEEEEDDD